MSFLEEWQRYSWEDVGREIESRSTADVKRALAARSPHLDDFMSLVSPAAEPYLEEMAQRSHLLTLQRFGRIISLFAPLYVSNVCTNRCVYCGFNAGNTVERLTLTVGQAVEEGQFIHEQGFRHLLLVSGEAPSLVSPSYLGEVVQALKPLFASIAVEVYPMATEDYGHLIGCGVDGLVIYQETYDERLYAEVHPAGRKRDFLWRLETPERGGEAGFRRIGLGALLGLNNWRAEVFFLALHASYLLRKYWRSHVTVSFPRLRPAAGCYEPQAPVSDFSLVQMMTALRLLLPDVGLVLSTRESAELRNNLIPLGITSMSAGSRTEPGGYTNAGEAEAQFAVADERPPHAVADVIRKKGYEPVWKDWDPAFLQKEAAA